MHAVQVDGGSEFCAEFKQTCQGRKLPLIVWPPYSSKLNTQVEYAQSTCRCEFYECTEMATDRETVRRQWTEVEGTYNRARSHLISRLQACRKVIGGIPMKWEFQLRLEGVRPVDRSLGVHGALRG